jgi:hypothetical protein
MSVGIREIRKASLSYSNEGSVSWQIVACRLVDG